MTASTPRAASRDPDHVVYISTDPGVPVFGRKGCSVHVQAMLHQLLARGARVDLVACRLGGDPPRGLRGLRVFELGVPTAEGPAGRERALMEQDARAAAVAVGLLRARGARRPLVYQRYALFSCHVMEAAARLGVPGVLEVNAPLIDEQARHRVLVDGAAARARTARALVAARLPYAVSSPVARWAERLVDGRRTVAVVPNGVDVDRFPTGEARRPPLAGPVTVVFVGTFRPWHGVDLLVEAAARLRDTGPVRLLLVGDGPQHSAVLRLAASRGVPVLASGPVDPDEIPRLLAAADIAAAPYPAGPAYFSPLKVLEYLAAGLPTVAAAVADLPAQVRDGRELLLVPPGDAGALTGALARLRDDPALRRRLGAAGRAAAEQRLTWRAVADRVLQLLEESRAAEPATAGSVAARS